MILKQVDLIIPVYFVNPNHFFDNLQSWVRELPIKRILFGIDKPSIDIDSFREGIKEYIPETVQIELIDQTQIKTLGKCLAELMKLVETEWFVYVHTDVFLTEHCWEVMKSFAKTNMGIIEGTPKHQYNNSFSDLGYYFKERSYSGFQLFQKKAISKIIEKIEDDYMYRNEDFIFRNAVENAGYEHKKVWSIYYHQNEQQSWSMDKAEAMDMQWKGLIKYATPDKVCLEACIAAIDYCVVNFNYSIINDFDFITNMPLKWKDCIIFFYLNKAILKLNNKNSSVNIPFEVKNKIELKKENENKKK